MLLLLFILADSTCKLGWEAATTASDNDAVSAASEFFTASGSSHDARDGLLYKVKELYISHIFSHILEREVDPCFF